MTRKQIIKELKKHLNNLAKQRDIENAIDELSRIVNESSPGRPR